MNCPICASTTRPGTIDGIHYAACCLVHGPLVWHSAAERERLAETPSEVNATTDSPKQAEAQGEARTITLPYPPTVNHLYASVNGRRVLSEEGKNFKAQARWQALIEDHKVCIGDVVLTVRAYRPRKSGDLDNILKATQDSLTGILWEDDKQIVEIHAYRYDDRLNPRVEVTISSAA